MARTAHPLDALGSLDGYCQHFMDPGLWRPFVEQVCRDHRLKCRSIRPGLAGTFPTFIVDERLVVKFFGPLFEGGTCWQVENEAAGLMAGAPETPVAKVIAAGRLESEVDWHYLVFDFVPGISLGEVYDQVPFEEYLALSRWLGNSLRQMHRLEIPAETSLPRLSKPLMQGWLASRREDSMPGWPEHLLSQLDESLASMDDLVQSADPHFIHADLTCDHFLGRLEKGRWTTLAIIDFGDAMLGNVYYELAALHLDLFDCDKRLLAAFLDAYGLSPDRDFGRKAMATALLHQFDVLGPLFERKPELREMRTLEELASRLWALKVTKG